MYWLDTTLLALVGLGAILGLWTGFLWQIARLVSLAVAVYVTMLANDHAAALLKEGPLRDADPRVVQTVAYVLVFLGVYLVMYLLTRLMHQSMRAADLVLFDRLLGGFLGAGKMALILAAVCLGAASYDHPVPREWMAKSTVAPIFAHAMESVLIVIPDQYKEDLRGALASLRDMMGKEPK
ncbi:MAG: CvpA family protein [Planctomycetes bacterium]|nr:CvpA family protein [Planctomycetota bacterium]